MANKVIILFTGYSYSDPDDSKYMHANCSCTLIQTKNGRNIIVDTMTAWDGEKIRESLKINNLVPKDIHIVVCTHGHSDHIGSNYLFNHAQWHIVGLSISNRDKYLEWPTNDNPEAELHKFQLDGDEVTIVRTPGHTLSCVTVLVQDTHLGKLAAVCGDLFENSEDIINPSIWLQAGSENPTLQRLNRLRIAEMCDYIIPGHGTGFKVTPQICDQLRKDLENNTSS